MVLLYLQIPRHATKNIDNPIMSTRLTAMDTELVKPESAASLSQRSV